LHAKAEPYKAKKEMLTDREGITDSQPMRNHDIKCFECLGSEFFSSRCLNKKTMIMKHDEIESASNKSDVDEMPLLKDYGNVEITYPVEGEALVIRRVLNAQVKEDNVDQ